ncbi:hypothetical protein DOTSEDRAFT_71745 [Dothistroma septosporum NZE10]|uniref:STAS domain-containing protein n=1 Tax=Dothistroma septosporum (strain NZE10 / CBS 128990) TaxID=675120 RepID=N1PL19_DOTSN|nr:hypothetical protein DOTSEDRAFT_71745 [Dothistroma septosporum NZE10]
MAAVGSTTMTTSTTVTIDSSLLASAPTRIAEMANAPGGRSACISGMYWSAPDNELHIILSLAVCGTLENVGPELGRRQMSARTELSSGPGCSPETSLGKLPCQASQPHHAVLVDMPKLSYMDQSALHV